VEEASRVTMREQSSPQFIARIRACEERLFANTLDSADPMRMKSHQYSWHYRPSHHASTGLITEDDVTMLTAKSKRLLSVGANPAYLERVLAEMGVPGESMVIADVLPEITAVAKNGVTAQVFDALQAWPEMGTFDLIIFPESLCIMLTDALEDIPIESHDAFPRDTAEAELLAHILGQALKRLQTGGVIRCNGPQSHPNVVKQAMEVLHSRGLHPSINYQRFFLRLQNSPIAS
jgi:hypothetical protein